MATVYKTASQLAILSGVIPIGLQASERKREWETKHVNVKTRDVADARKQTIQNVQEKWNIETSGR